MAEPPVALITVLGGISQGVINIHAAAWIRNVQTTSATAPLVSIALICAVHLSANAVTLPSIRSPPRWALCDLLADFRS